MMLEDLPWWISVPASLFLVIGGLLTLIGSLGLIRLHDFFMRLHAPTMGSTLGTGFVLWASILISSGLAGRPVVHEVLITVFVVLTAPVTSILMLRAAIYRTGVNAKRRHEDRPLPDAQTQVHSEPTDLR